MKYDINIIGEIGWWPNTGRCVRDEVLSLKGKPVNVYLNSPGGSAVDGLEIYEAFREHGDVTVHIFGFTASAATILAMGAKNIEMSQNALLLIHKASLFQDFWGSMNSDQLENAIKALERSKDTLNKVDEIIANIYALRAGGTKEDFLTKMKVAEWLTAAEVKNLGLIDKVKDDSKVENVMTNEVKNLILNQQLPLPSDDLLKSRPSFTDRVKTVLSQLGFGPAAPEKETNEDCLAEHKPQIIMNKEFACINALLGIEGVEAKDGHVTLSIDDLKKINNAIETANNKATTAEQQVTDKDNQIAGLQTEINNLKKGDGAESPKNEGDKPQNDSESQTHSILDDYNSVKDFV